MGGKGRVVESGGFSGSVRIPRVGRHDTDPRKNPEISDILLILASWEPLRQEGDMGGLKYQIFQDPMSPA